MRILSVPLIALLLASCGSVGASGGKIGSDTRSFAGTGFDRVVLAGPDDVSVSVGPAFAVRARGDQDVLDRLEIGVVDGELRVARKRSTDGWTSGDRAKVDVTMPRIRGATLSGAGKLEIDRAEAPSFEGVVSGAGGFRLGTLKSQTASFRLSGAGGLAVDGGETGTLDIAVSGAGGVTTDKLTARNLAVEVSGVGSIDARATEAATGRVSGVGSVTVRGTDRCNIRKSGVGSVTCGK